MLQTSDLYIVADDLTGACDVAACFSAVAGPMEVFISPEVVKKPDNLAVINTQTRLLSAQDSYETLKSIGSRLADKKIIFKKIDTALRGQVGAELQGLLDGVGEKTGSWETIVAPAIPKIGKTTRDGLQYDDGVPINRTAYADDLLTPVNSANIAEIIRQTGQLEFKVCDAQTDDDLRSIISESSNGNKKVFVGSLGLAAVLAEKLERVNKGDSNMPTADRAMIVCGSRYERSQAQIEKAAVDMGVKVVYIHPTEMTPDQLSWLKNENVCLLSITPEKIETSEYQASKIVNHFVSTIAELVRHFRPQGLGIVGGETAYHLLKKLNVNRLRIYGRMAQVISYGVIEDGQVAGLPFLTKGGSVGPDDSVIKMINLLKTGEGQAD